MMHIYRQEEIRQIDLEAVQEGKSIKQLMNRAGKGLFHRVSAYIDSTDRILVLAGRGNNGGDGIVLAYYLARAGYFVQLAFPLGKPKSEAAQHHLAKYQGDKLPVVTFSQETSYHASVIVDALLGIGVKGELRTEVKQVLAWCNQQSGLKIAIDQPTGLQADIGHVLGEAFEADYTFALHGPKPSAFLEPSSLYYGLVEAVDIGLPHKSHVKVIDRTMVAKGFKVRPKSAHKGNFGTGLLIAGSDEMPGSVTLSSIGAIRSGIGKLLVGTTKHAATIVANHVPEAMFSYQIIDQILENGLPDKIQTIAMGPGLENQSTAEKILEALWEEEQTLIIDAGALIKREHWLRQAPLILTPHPGELSRLTGLGVKEIQANRIEVAREFSFKNKIILVLKGKNSIIALPNKEVWINPTGNAALAKGGSGDVLTGMILGLIHNTNSVFDAVRNAVYIHGECADVWQSEKATYTMVASDFNQLLPSVMKSYDPETR